MIYSNFIILTWLTLRRAKSKDGGKSLRDKLKSHGLVLPAGRKLSIFDKPF
jgi:hypothetical protein